jgi:hypothetical protein
MSLTHVQHTARELELEALLEKREEELQKAAMFGSQLLQKLKDGEANAARMRELLDDKLREDALASKEHQEVEAVVEKLNALQSKFKSAQEDNEGLKADLKVGVLVGLYIVW